MWMVMWYEFSCVSVWMKINSETVLKHLRRRRSFSCSVDVVLGGGHWPWPSSRRKETSRLASEVRRWPRCPPVWPSVFHSSSNSCIFWQVPLIVESALYKAFLKSHFFYTKSLEIESISKEEWFCFFLSLFFFFSIALMLQPVNDMVEHCYH